MHADCHLRAGGGRYSVPYRYVGRRLDVRLGERTVLLYDGTAPVASHARQPRRRPGDPRRSTTRRPGGPT